MNITRDNYESFFLDYLEGKLEENMIDEFLDFLEQHPDLKEELQLLEPIHLPEEQIVFQGKSHLYKSAGDEKAAFEKKSIAFMEGDLEEGERALFETYLAQHPELKRDQQLFLKTRLVADTRINYPHKQKLYKKSGTILLMNWVTRAAAAVLLLWGLHALFQPGSQSPLPTNLEIASVKQQPVDPVNKIEPVVKTVKTQKIETPLASAEPKLQNKNIGTQVNSPSTPLNENTNVVERDLSVLEEIHPMMASMEREADDNQLAVAQLVNVEKINSPRNIMGVDEFLASRVKRAGNEGLLSANRILRTGLNVALEISGDRIGYKVKNGKISSVDFESKLMAFSIPLQKK